MTLLNETHELSLSSWITKANQHDCEFSIQNLPFSSSRVSGDGESYRGGVAIGDQIVDLLTRDKSGLLSGLAQNACEAAAQPKLNAFMAMSNAASSALRLWLSRLLRKGSDAESQLKSCLVAKDVAEYQVPCQIGDYTDFYTSFYHATNVGKQFRPDNPLLPNYKWIPVGYHGRASSIDVSGQTFHRPHGKLKEPDADTPPLETCKRLDLELEMSIFIGAGNELGALVTIDEAEDHVFGICLFNDWSARDIQAWEYQPLGPFLAKNFASTISPWLITMEALAPFRSAFSHPVNDPQPLPYLTSNQNSEEGGLDIKIQVLVQTEKMRETDQPLSRFRHLTLTIPTGEWRRWLLITRLTAVTCKPVTFLVAELNRVQIRMRRVLY